MEKNHNSEYQSPRADIVSLQPEGVLCASGETDDFTMDHGLGLEDYF